jgi:hypothetical protein
MLRPRVHLVFPCLNILCVHAKVHHLNLNMPNSKQFEKNAAWTATLITPTTECDRVLDQFTREKSIPKRLKADPDNYGWPAWNVST